MNDESSATTEIAAAQSLIEKFCAEREWDQFHTPKDLAIGITTEAAELLDLFRFQSPEQVAAILADGTKREKVEDELADVFFFVLRFAQMNGIDFRKALARKLDKNAKKYPVEKSRGSNKKYDEL